MIVELSEAFKVALEHHRAGRQAEAEKLYLAIIQAQPTHPEANNNLAVIAMQNGKPMLALPYCRTALEMRPDVGQFRLTYSEALLAAGFTEQALAEVKEAMRLGVQGPAVEGLHLRVEQACARQAARSRTVRAGMNRPVTRRGRKKLLKEMIKPSSNRGQRTEQTEEMRLAALFTAGRYAELETEARWLTTHYPNKGLGWKFFGLVLMLSDRFREALPLLERAEALLPGDPDVCNALGVVLKNLGRLDEAVISYQKALALKPDCPEAHTNLGNALQDLGRLDEAVVCHQKALALKPDYGEAHNNLGNALQILGRPDEAVACYQKALALKPDYAHALSNLLYLYSFSQILPPEEELIWTQRAEQIFTPDSARILIQKQLRISSRIGRPLRLGIVSAELGEHAVAYFLEPVLSHFDPRRLQVTLYPTVLRTEDAAKRWRDAADSWVPLAGVPDERAAERIREDRIDILLDTTGHTRGCRLGIFAHRAAPVQCHYIGYFGTTGLTQMDYFIGDDIVTPVSLDPYFQEKIWRLPRLWYAYSGPEEAPEPTWAPATDGSIRLGSFNRLAKSSESCLALWAKVLHALPEARLLLKDKMAASTGARERIVNTLKTHGIKEDRLEFAGHVPDWRGHMALYDRMDIALDTIPFNSATTGFDALWMGVPMITLEGSRMGGRFGTAMLTSLGHPEWVARNEEEYVEKVVTLARNIEKRRSLRFTQREKMRQSPLCDGAGLARALEEAFEEMFDLWFEREKGDRLKAED